MVKLPRKSGLPGFNTIDSDTQILVTVTRKCWWAIAVFSTMMAVIVSCSSSERASSPEAQTPETAEADHADNDIAMTLRSLTDAISVREPLDSLDYDYEGILTDGLGRPLYTDIQGTPGEWQVDILSDRSAVVRNIYLGDLLPDDLLSYITQSLGLTDADRIHSDDFADDDETTQVMYHFEGGTLRFITRAAVAPNGLEGPLVSIIVSGDE